MGQILLQDNIPPLVKASSTTCTLAATHMGKTTRITIGGQQYALSSGLTLNTATTGLGGLDTGVLAGTHTLYYVYACANSSGVVGLVASLATPSTGPTGFTSRYQLVGAFYTRDIAEVGSTVTIEGEAESEWIEISTSGASAMISNLNISGGGGGIQRIWWQRKGDTMWMKMFLRMGTNTTASGGAVGINTPSPFVADVSNTIGTGKGTLNLFAGNIGTAQWYDNSGGPVMIDIYPYLITNANIRFAKINMSDLASVTDIPSNQDDRLGMLVNIPISGWTKTLLG